ncbi:hypothetical protein Tco_0213561 [Tanacetum coccineum]
MNLARQKSSRQSIKSPILREHTLTIGISNNKEEDKDDENDSDDLSDEGDDNNDGDDDDDDDDANDDDK